MNIDFAGMLGAVAAPFTGGASLALTGLSSAASFFGDKYAMKKQQAFERDMSSTAHQREVADLQAAGLNPILSATGGGGASYHGVPAPALGSGVVSSAIGAKRAIEELKLVKRESDLRYYDTILRESDIRKRNAELHTQEQTTRNLKTEGEILKKDLSIRGSAEAAARTEEQIDETTAGRVLRWLDRFSRSIRGAGSSAKSVEPWKR